MTLYQKANWFTAATIAAFLILVAFNYGRMTASTINLRSSCDITSEQRVGLKPNYYNIAWGR